MKQLNQDKFTMIILKDLGMVYPTTKSKGKKRMAIFICNNCKNEIRSQPQDAIKNKRGLCRSCIAKTTNLKHGDRNTRLYRIWGAMKTRTSNKNQANAHRYVNRGITMCKEWRDDYLTFKKWAIKNGYAKDLTIDRRDNDGNYEPSNCRWVNMSVQNVNKSGYGKSGYKGVYYREGKDCYRAFLSYLGKTHYIIDTCKTPEEAAKAYNAYIIENNLPHQLNKII